MGNSKESKIVEEESDEFWDAFNEYIEAGGDPSDW